MDKHAQGRAPLQMLKKGMGETLWREKEILALNCLKEGLHELPTARTSDAWLGMGLK